MALAIVLGVRFSYIRKRAANHEGGAPITREFLAANTLFYGFLFVGILFFWNWFNFRSPDFTGVGPETVSLGVGVHRCRAAAAFVRDGPLPAERQQISRQLAVRGRASERRENGETRPLKKMTVMRSLSRHRSAVEGRHLHRAFVFQESGLHRRGGAVGGLGALDPARPARGTRLRTRRYAPGASECAVEHGRLYSGCDLPRKSGPSRE